MDFDKVAPVLQVISQGCVLHMKFGGFLYSMFSKILQMNYYCAGYTETTWNDFAKSHQSHAKSHQLRTMKVCGYINFVT